MLYKPEKSGLPSGNRGMSLLEGAASALAADDGAWAAAVQLSRIEAVAAAMKFLIKFLPDVICSNILQPSDPRHTLPYVAARILVLHVGGS